jgi:hypothetical protein
MTKPGSTNFRDKLRVSWDESPFSGDQFVMSQFEAPGIDERS